MCLLLSTRMNNVGHATDEDKTWEGLALSTAALPYRGDRSRNIGWQMFQPDALIPEARDHTDISLEVSCHKNSRGLHMSGWLVGVHEVAILTDKKTYELHDHHN